MTDYSSIADDYYLLSALRQCNPFYNHVDPRSNEILAKYPIEKIQLANKYLHNYYARHSRLKKRIRGMFLFFDDVYFVTLTISVENMSNIPRDTLFLYAKRVLHQSFVSYILNEDFSPEKGRLHFHAVVAGRKSAVANGGVEVGGEKSVYLDWKYGFYDVQHIDSNDVCTQRRVLEYIDKFVNHCTKNGVGRMAYSRTRSFEEHSLDDDIFVKYMFLKFDDVDL